jgi:hypothetical protein
LKCSIASQMVELFGWSPLHFLATALQMIAEEFMTAAPAVAAAHVGLAAGAGTSSLEMTFELLSPWWVELCFLISFPLGYFFLNFSFSKGLAGKSMKKQPSIPRSGGQDDAQAERLHRDIEVDSVAGESCKAVARWRKARGSVASTPETFRLVVQALAATGAETLVEEVAEHMETHAHKLCNAKTALAVLDAVGHGKHPEQVGKVSVMQDRLSIPVTFQWYEALLGGHAFAGLTERVDALCAEIHAQGQKLTARGYLLFIEGFLCKGMLVTAVKHMETTHVQGFYVPPLCGDLALQGRLGCPSLRGDARTLHSGEHRVAGRGRCRHL